MIKRMLIVFLTINLISLIGCSNSDRTSESKSDIIQAETEPFEENESTNFFILHGNRIDMGEYGSIEMPVEWSYMEEPESERPAVYYGDKNNQMIVYNFEYSEDIKVCAETYVEIQQKHSDIVLMKQIEIDGCEAYKIDYDRNGEYIIAYIFACTDGVNRHISFMGDRAIELSDSMIKTYHLYN